MLTTGTTIEGLAGSYRCEEKHGEGGFAIAYAGTRESDDAPVILKELRIERLKDWKAVELFEREAGILAKLDHPRIPAHYDFFAWDGTKAVAVATLANRTESEPTSLVLVQQRLSGESLAARIEGGVHASSEEVEQLFRGMLEILQYLHELHPPVIHRDINPSNILVDGEGEPYLVDFGGVQDRLRLASGGSTQIGTVGYMPLEQLSGASRPATDLYALGMTLLSTLSHVAPHEMPIDDETSKVKVDELVPTLEPRLRDAISSMVEPLAGNRAKSAADVLAQLDGRAPPPTPGGPRSRAPLFIAAGALVVLGGSIAYSTNAHSPTVPDATPVVPPPTPTVATSKPPETPVPLKKVSGTWKAHAKLATGVAIAPGAPCTVRADLESYLDMYKTPRERASHLAISCQDADKKDKVVYTQETPYLQSNVSDYPGSAPKTYARTMEISDSDGPTRVHTNTLQSQMEITRSGSSPFELRLFVEHLSADEPTALDPDIAKKERGLTPSVSRTGHAITVRGKAPIKAGATCVVTAESRWRREESGEKINCAVRFFCDDLYIYSHEGTCAEEGPLKVHFLSFEGVNEQRHDLTVDFAANTVTFDDGVDPEDKYAIVVQLAK